MGFLNYLKKIISNEEIKVESTKKDLSLDEIKVELASKEKDLSNKNEELKDKLTFLVKENISLLKDALNSLKKVNLNKVRENERLKGLVMENVNLYISCLENFIKDLETFEDIDQLNKKFEFFFKNSYKIYQKAIILVGKEFEVILAILKKFALEFNLLLKENQENKHKMHKFREVEEKFNEIAKIHDIKKEIKENILKLNEHKEKKEIELVKNKKNKQEIVKSADYIKDLEEKKQIRSNIKKLEDEISEILAKINLKELAGMYHRDERKHKVIQDYIKDYKKAIEEDKEGNLKKIVKEVRSFDIDLDEINNKINNLDNFTTKNEMKVKQIEEEINDLEIQIKELNNNINEEEKKLIKFDNKKQEIESELKLEVKNMF